MDFNAERLRHKFVDTNGKIALNVQISCAPENINWFKLVKTFSDLIDQNTKGEVKDWVITNFSTTTPEDLIVSRIALMGAMKHYFEYEGGCVCGIPSITLEGTLEDWKQIKRKIEKLSEYGLEE